MLNETGRLTQRQAVVITALLAHPQFAQVRRSFLDEINKIASDPGRLDDLSGPSNITPPDLKNAATYLSTIEGKHEPLEMARQSRALIAFFETPEVRNYWSAFNTRAKQLLNDQRVIDEIGHQYNLTPDEVRQEFSQITTATTVNVVSAQTGGSRSPKIAS